MTNNNEHEGVLLEVRKALEQNNKDIFWEYRHKSEVLLLEHATYLQNGRAITCLDAFLEAVPDRDELRCDLTDTEADKHFNGAGGAHDWSLYLAAKLLSQAVKEKPDDN